MDILLYLNIFDFFVLIIFFSSLLIGISRGLYIEIISNAIWVSALLIAWFFRYTQWRSLIISRMIKK